MPSAQQQLYLMVEAVAIQTSVFLLSFVLMGHGVVV
jgi:hypothetical protein